MHENIKFKKKKGIIKEQCKKKNLQKNLQLKTQTLFFSHVAFITSAKRGSYVTASAFLLAKELTHGTLEHDCLILKTRISVFCTA